MRYLILFLFIFCFLNSYSQNCYDTIQVNWIQFCEFTKDHQKLTDCDGHDCLVSFVIKEDEIIKINGKDIEIYNIEVASKESSGFDDIRISDIYFLEKDNIKYTFIKLKEYSIIRIYSNYSSVALGNIIQRRTYINKSDFNIN